MTLGRVVGTVTATVKNPALTGHTMLIVQPVDPSGAPKGKSVVAVDAAQAGEGDLVLVLDEGNSSRMILGDPNAPVRTMVVGIVDQVRIGGDA